MYGAIAGYLVQKALIFRKKFYVCIADGCNDGSGSGYDCSIIQNHDNAGVINTSWAVTLPSIFGASCPGLAGAFGVFMMRQFFMGVPKELNEAAEIDGAGPIRTFISIMLPMAKSTLASLAIIVFTYSWNDYFTTFIMINDTEKLTLPVGILSIKQPFSTGDNVVFAAVVLAILPVLIVFLIGQKWIVKSMTHVGVKDMC